MYCLKIAAMILYGDQDPGKIHHDLQKRLIVTDSYIKKVKPEGLLSRQAIGMIIADWVLRNPDEEPYKEE